MVAVVSSCKNSKMATSNSNINGTISGSEMLYQNEWKLAEVQGTIVSGRSKASLLFTPGQINSVTGSTGCNRLNGSFNLSGTNEIKFSPLAVTRMACLDNLAGETENKFLNAINATIRWSIVNHQLLLSNGNEIVAKFNAVKPVTAEQKKLIGTWQLNYISGPKIAFDGLFPNRKPEITFDLPATEISGFGGCNGFSCKITLDGNKINFGDALSTMMACEGNGEPLFFKTLKTVTSFTVSDDNTLHLIMGDIAVLRFVKK